MVGKTLNQDFFKTWTPEMAYVLGFFAADGNMIHAKRGGYFISFHVTDRSILQQIRKVMGSGHKIATRHDPRPNYKMGYRLQIGSKEIYSDLALLGFTPRKSKNLMLPNMPAEYLCHFVHGYFDGDGCVYFSRLKFADRKNLRWTLMTLFTCGDKSFLEKLHGLLKLHGIAGVWLRLREVDLSWH